MAAVYENPVSGTIVWADIEDLLVAAGCRLVEGAGSRVRFENDGLIATFHRTRPANEAKRYPVRDARDYLSKLGIKP